MLSGGNRVRVTLALFSAAIAVAVPSLCAQNLILNGDFETDPNVPNGTVTDWTVSGTAHIHAEMEGATSGSYSAAFNVGVIPKAAILSQNFTTIIGHNYTVEFDSAIAGQATGSLQLIVQVSGNGTLFDQTITPPSSSSRPFQHYQYEFAANSTTTTLRFTDVGFGNASADTVVDTVSVKKSPSHPRLRLPLDELEFRIASFLFGW